MFEQSAIIKTPAAAEEWLRAIVDAYGSGGFVSFPKDCEEIVEHFAKVGVKISIDDANSFWNAHSENLQSGWVGLSVVRTRQDRQRANGVFGNLGCGCTEFAGRNLGGEHGRTNGRLN